VAQVIREASPVTRAYGLISLIIAYGVSIPLGIVKAMRHRTLIDTLSSVVIFIGYAVPGYAVGALLVVYLSAHLGWFPMGGFVSENFSDLSAGRKVLDFIRHAALPITCYSLGSFAFVSLIPLVTDLGQQIAAILAGSILVETIFDINGMGLLFYNAVVDRDPMVVMGVLLIDALFLLGCNLLTDVAIAFVDPRIRFR
jgi:microcin C transport system permease protein